MAAASNSTAVETRSRRAKRARTEEGLGQPHGWASGHECMIAEQVLADDVAGYLRFRSVCGSWRRCAPPPHAHDVFDRQFHPRRWIMLPEVFAGQFNRRDFLNVSTGERIRADRHEFVTGPTSEGLILLCRKRTGAVRLLNPLTGQLTALPDATSLLCSLNRPYSSRWKSRTGLSKLKKLQGFSAGLAGSSTVALHFDEHEHEHELAVAKPDGERWSRRVLPCSITSILDSIVAALSFTNSFYCFTRNGIRVLDADATEAGQRPRLVAVEVGQDFRGQCRDASLADNDGELILLRLSWRSITEPYPYDVYRVDLDAGEMVPVHGLRGRAVFVCDSGAGRGRSLSMHAGLSSSIRADAIYWCRSDRYGMADGRPGIDVFLVPDDRWIQHDLRVPPGSIVDYLSRYVCPSGDIVVPAPPLRSSVMAAAAAAAPRERKANPRVIGNEWVN